MVSVAERWRSNSDVLLNVFDLAGTLVFALEGAMRAIRGDLDFLGLLVLAFVTAVGGGIIRDLLIGATPPAARMAGFASFARSRLMSRATLLSHRNISMRTVDDVTDSHS
jgi:uncharacterized membrane protein YeiH